MLSAITKALDEVSFKIPKPILDAVFSQRDRNYRAIPISINEQILNLVIRPRVLIDCNLVGGTEAFIPLEGLPSERTDDWTTIYRIPKAYTQNRSIISVLSITLSDPNKQVAYGAVASGQASMMMQAGAAVMDSFGTIPVTSSSKVSLIGENVVMIKDTIVLPSNIYLRCLLAHDENMSNLQLKSYRAFAELVTHAVKAYIYNQYIIRLDQGELYAGQSLGKFKEIIDNYADSEQNYQDYITEKWQKIALMNDAEQFTRLLKLQLGGNR